MKWGPFSLVSTSKEILDRKSGVAGLEKQILKPMIDILIKSVWNEEELPDQWKESILYQFTKGVTKLTVMIME
jgi:hypothetical protein